MEFTNFADLVVKFGTLTGCGSLIAVIVNVLKLPGWVKDGDAPKVSIGLNIVGLALLFAVGVFRPQADVAGLDEMAGTVATILSMLAGLIWQVASGRLTHIFALKGAPGIGKSYSYEAERAAELIKVASVQADMLQREDK